MTFRGSAQIAREWPHEDNYEGSDADILHRLTSERFTPHHLDIVGKRRLNASFRTLHRGRLAAYDLTFGTAVRITPGELPPRYIVRLGHTGRAALTVGGEAKPYSPSIISPGQEASSHWDSDTSTRFLCIPRHVVDAALQSQISQQLDKPLVFDPVINPHRPEVKAWLALAQQLAGGLAGVLSTSELAVEHFEQMLVHYLIAIQPHEWTADLTKELRVYGRGPVYRAMTFCEENAHRAISLAEIAAAARVSVRTLQTEFRRRLDMTPKAYLREVRLAGAHADLRAVGAGSIDVSIAEIARKWGFAERRYFTAVYTRAYGRSPSETARRPSGRSEGL